jgi:WD40 repeat protein
VWDAATTQETILKGHEDATNSVSFSPDGKRIVSGSSWDSTVRVWNLVTGQAILTLANIHCVEVSFSADGSSFAAGESDGTVTIWDSATGRRLLELDGHSDVCWSVAYSRDGSQLASSSDDKTVKLWDVTTGKELNTLKAPSGVIRSIAFSPDGKLLAGAGGRKNIDGYHQVRVDNQPGAVYVWNARTGHLLLTLEGHTGTVQCVVFSMDGKQIASASRDKSVKLWESATGKLLHTLTSHTHVVSHVAFSPIENRVASSSLDGTVKVWNTRTGRELLTLKGSNPISSVAFSPSGRRIAAGFLRGSNANTVKVYDARQWTTELRVEQRASAFILAAYEDLLTKDAVIEKLNNDKTISQNVQKKAQQLIKRYPEKTAPKEGDLKP